MNSLIISEFKNLINLYEKVIQYLTETYDNTQDDIKHISKSLDINKLTYKVYRLKKSLEIIREYPMEIKKIEDMNRIKGITPLISDYINQIITNGKITDNILDKEFIVYFGLEKICEDVNADVGVDVDVNVDVKDEDKDKEVNAILEQPLIDDKNKKESLNIEYDDSMAFFGGCINNPFQNIGGIFTNLLNYIY
jgi:hypothetical protein